MFSVGLRYALVRSVSTRAIVASGGRHAFRPTLNAWVASRSFAVVADTVNDLEGPKEAVVKKPGRKAEEKEKAMEAKAQAAKKTKEAQKKGAKEKKKTKVASELAAEKESEEAKKLEKTEKKKAAKIKAKEKALALAAKRKEVAKAKEHKALTKTTRPPFKPPLSSYQNFIKSHLQGVCAEKPVTAIRSIFSDAVAKWRGMTASEKEAYETEDFAAAMQEHRVKYSEWKKNLNRKERRAFSARFTTGPTRINSYSVFSKETFPKGLTGSFAETSRQVSAAYNALSPAEKEVYAQRARELRDKGLAEEKERKEKEKEEKEKKKEKKEKESPTV